MGLVDKNYPIFFYPYLHQSATGRASDKVVTPSDAIGRLCVFNPVKACEFLEPMKYYLGTAGL
jgi:hypothetical protein